MRRWSTTGLAQLVKLVIVPLFGLAMLLIEQQRDTPRPLLVTVGLVLVGIAPASVVELFLTGRGNQSTPPAAPTPPTPPPVGTPEGSSTP